MPGNKKCNCSRVKYFIERLGGSPQPFRYLAMGETAITGVKQGQDAEGCRTSLIAKSVEKQRLEDIGV